MLTTMCLPDKATSLIINLAILRCTMKIDIIDAHDLNWFYHLVNPLNLNREAFLDFATHNREKLVH